MSKPDDFVGFYVFDVETSCVKGADGEWKSMPWDAPADPTETAPAPLLFGTLPLDTGLALINGTFKGFAVKESVVVGHNLKFDAAHAPSIRLQTTWDTMVAEYILTAQQSKFASLASLVDKYAPAMHKPDLIGENLGAGIPPQNIPKAELEEYLENDLACTAAVFKAQWALTSPAQRALIFVQSAASLVYGEMEANGLTLDVDETIKQRDAADADYKAAMSVGAGWWDAMGDLGVRCSDDILAAEWAFTPTALSMWFFGSPGEATIDVPLTAAERAVAPKRRVNRKVKVFRPGLLPVIPRPPLAPGKTLHSVAEEVLDEISAMPDLHPAHAGMIDCVLKARGAQKASKTYYTPWLETIEHTTDRRLHPKIHATATDTGRTSSANPNAQNIPDGGRKCVVTRFDCGALLEADFKQLEVCGLAEVSKCPALIAALKAGDDIHYMSGREVFGWTDMSQMDKEMRRVVKTINFGLIYGGSAKTLARQAGIEPALAQRLIDSFYTRFPGVKEWQDETYELATNAPDHIYTVASAEGTTRVHVLDTPTGRGYAFTMEPSKWRAGMSLSPTKVKNYPIQGFATGDIVPLAVMLIRNMLRERYSDVLPLLVVHDSLLLDLPNTGEYGYDTLMADMRHIVSNVLPAAMRELWGIELEVPLALDIELSKTWKPR